jgi:anti-anti-sigma regulatory factor
MEIGRQLRPDTWGNGYATEATHALAAWAFSQDVREVFAVVRPGNTRAAATVRNNGMHWVGETTKYFGVELQVFRLRVADVDSFEAFSREREEIIRDQAEQLLELMTPVVRIWEGGLAVPLVGTLDSARTQVVMEMLVETGSDHAIIDITGVFAVDTQVARHLLKTVVAAQLPGAECIVSGIRPQTAQTIVVLGIEFGDIVTKPSLADALRHALREEPV